MTSSMKWGRFIWYIFGIMCQIHLARPQQLLVCVYMLVLNFYKRIFMSLSMLELGWTSMGPISSELVKLSWQLAIQWQVKWHSGVWLDMKHCCHGTIVHLRNEWRSCQLMTSSMKLGPIYWVYLVVRMCQIHLRSTVHVFTHVKACSTSLSSVDHRFHCFNERAYLAVRMCTNVT